MLADDDKYYKPWALSGLDELVRRHSLRRHAYSYEVANDFWSLKLKMLMYRAGREGGPPAVRLGQGADLMALPASVLLHRDRQHGRFADDAENSERVSSIYDFFKCATRVEPMFRWHDDMWISTWLLLQNVTMLRALVNWTGVHNLEHHCWKKNTGNKQQYSRSSLLYINDTLGGLRLTHTRINLATHAGFGRVLVHCADPSQYG